MSDYSEQLLPCPWCGGKVEWHSADHILQIRCPICDYWRNFAPLVGNKETEAEIRPGVYYNRTAQEDAVKIWNTRAGEKLPDNYMIINKDKLHCDCSWDYEDDYYTAYSMIAIEAAEVRKDNDGT